MSMDRYKESLRGICDSLKDQADSIFDGAESCSRVEITITFDAGSVPELVVNRVSNPIFAFKSGMQHG